LQIADFRLQIGKHGFSICNLESAICNLTWSSWF
jgi:hypothetical protein